MKRCNITTCDTTNHKRSMLLDYTDNTKNQPIILIYELYDHYIY